MNKLEKDNISYLTDPKNRDTLVIEENEKHIHPPRVITNEKKEYDIKEEDVKLIEEMLQSKLLSIIGFGGFSIVRLIYSFNQKSYFALKVINLNNKKFRKKTVSKNKEFVNQEIVVNFNVKNSNIIKLYGYYNHKEYILLLLEYMNNRDLKQFMKSFDRKDKKNFSEVLACFFIHQILKAMAYLKSRNILHRDIKPENIMLNTKYVAKLGDFSLSKKIDLSCDYKTSRSGTIPYLSPECVKKKMSIKPTNVEKLDLFSLGVLMYYFLYNRHPYHYKPQMTCPEYSKVLSSNEPLSFEGNNISEYCKTFLNGLLNKNYHNRFSMDQAINHPWLVLTKLKVDEIFERYQSDPDKMINVLNNTEVTDEYFKLKEQDYKLINVFDEIKKTDLLSKKRKRNKTI